MPSAAAGCDLFDFLSGAGPLAVLAAIRTQKFPEAYQVLSQVETGFTRTRTNVEKDFPGGARPHLTALEVQANPARSFSQFLIAKQRWALMLIRG
jgi:hypothetical protein